ncbi:ABC transporter ATP-binding protein [Cohnella faecalis]|nr:ABC transporter ATP-binding protein [Cohnella faecalis]
MVKLQYWQEFKRAMSYMKPRAWTYGIGIVGNNVIAALGLNILMAFIYKDIVNAAVGSDMPLLLRSIGTAFALLAVSSLLCTILTYRYNASIRYTMTDIRQQTFRHVQRLPMSRFENTHSGEMLSRMTNDLNTIEHLYADSLGGIIYAVVVGFAAAIAMFALNWPIALFAIALGILTFYVNTRFADSFRKINDEIQRGTGKMTQALSDVISGVPLVKMFSLGGVIIRKYDQTNEDVAGLSTKRTRKYAYLDSVNSVLGSLSFVGIVIVGGAMALKKGTDFGTVMAFIKLQGNIGFMFSQAGNLATDVQRVLAGANRVFELLDDPVEREGSERSLLGDEKKAIELDGAVFRYGEGAPALDRLSLAVERGQTVALVGPSGGGKSTVVKLLLGFYPIESGSVKYWGRSGQSYSLSEVRDMIAYVPQEAYLFDGTIEENIRYGNMDASREAIIAAAKAANAHEFIQEQPDGYLTAIGERGSRLSGGQKQRIAIARAFLKNAPILLLDEPTSALDAESEKQVQDALRMLAKGRTVILVAHRLSTVEHADRIYVIDRGQSVEEGRHEELIRKQGLYERLYRLQLKDAAG